MWHIWSVKESLKRVFGYARHTRSDKESFSNMSAPMILRENVRCAFLSILSLLAMIKTIPVLKKLPLKRVSATCGMRRAIKRVFPNMSAPMISRENTRFAFLSISSLLATIKMIPVLKKLPLKRVFSYAQHAQSVKESLKRVFSYSWHARSDKREFKESFSNMSAPMISRENARCAILQILSLLATLDMIPVLKNSLLAFENSF